MDWIKNKIKSDIYKRDFKDSLNSDLNTEDLNIPESTFNNDRFINAGMVQLYIDYINRYYNAETFKKKALDDILRNDNCFKILGYTNLKDLYAYINNKEYAGRRNDLWPIILNHFDNYKDMEIYTQGVLIYIEIIQSRFNKMKNSDSNITYKNYTGNKILFDSINNDLKSTLISIYDENNIKLLKILADHKDHLFVGDTMEKINHVFSKDEKRPTNSVLNFFTNIHKRQSAGQLKHMSSVSNLVMFPPSEEIAKIINQHTNEKIEDETGVLHDSVHNNITKENGIISIKRINGNPFDIKINTWMTEELKK
jgi:hypothetical protein